MKARITSTPASGTLNAVKSRKRIADFSAWVTNVE